jgi:hypothetical protein
MAIDTDAFKHAYQAAADWVSSNPEVHERYPHAPMIEAAIEAYEQARAQASPDMVQRVTKAVSEALRRPTKEWLAKDITLAAIAAM